MAWDISAIAAAAPATAAPVQPFGAEAEMSLDDAPDAQPVGGAFFDLMQRGIDDVSSSMSTAEDGMRALAAGRPVELHEVMIGLERARMSVQVFVQVRNRLVEAWQDLMRMQA